MENIEKNRDFLLNDIRDFHQNSNFKKLNVTKLVAVSKKQEDYKIDLAIKIGQKSFGENRVQEAQMRWEERQKIYNDLELRFCDKASKSSAFEPTSNPKSYSLPYLTTLSTTCAC